MTGELFIVSGPSGAGKGTLLAKVLPELDDIALTVSATTRKPRKGEREGTEYYFLSEKEFIDLIESGGFLEWARVHSAYYGTLKSEVERHRQAGQDVVLEIDTQGAAQVRAQDPSAVLVFIAPPDLKTLQQRLVGRDSDHPQEIARRLETAQREMERIPDYDFVVVNDDLDAAAAQLLQFIQAKRDTVSN